MKVLTVKFEEDNEVISGIGVEFFPGGPINGRAGCTACAHIHPSIELLYVYEGDFRIVLEGKQYMISKGDMVFFRPNKVHSIYAEQRTGRYYVLKLRQSLLSELADKENGIMYLVQLDCCADSQKDIWTAEEITPYLPYWKAMIENFNSDDFARDIFIKANALLLVSTILRNHYVENPFYGEDTNYTAVLQVYQALDYMHRHYAEEISAKDCAEKAGMSYAYFSHMFKKILGKSFTSYLTEIRINHAEKELLLTDKSVTEIASVCGFNNVSYFIAKYKALRGKTPYHFRREV